MKIYDKNSNEYKKNENEELYKKHKTWEKGMNESLNKKLQNEYEEQQPKNKKPNKYFIEAENDYVNLEEYQNKRIVHDNNSDIFLLILAELKKLNENIKVNKK